MLSRRVLAVVAICLATNIFTTDAVRGDVITTFEDAFQLTTPAAGWQYLINSAGAIGDPANYTALLPNSSGAYTFGGSNTSPAAEPGGWVSFQFIGDVAGGHPGPGVSQSASAGIERFAIAAFEMPVAGPVALQDGWIQNVNPNFGGSTDGISVKVYVNNSPTPAIESGTGAGYQSTGNFAGYLGQLNIGDKIYVAVGSRNEDLFDGFQMRYSIVNVPEPTTFALLATLALVMLGVRRQR